MESIGVHNVMVVLEKDNEKWFWEITTFQTKDDECYGSAKERNKDIEFPWVKIENLNLTETMVKICKEFMGNTNK